MAAERVLRLLAAGTALAGEPYAAWADPARDELRELLRAALNPPRAVPPHRADRHAGLTTEPHVTRPVRVWRRAWLDRDEPEQARAALAPR